MKRHFFLTILFLFLAIPKIIFASSLSINPSNGNFAVGETFDVSIMVDTQGKSVNALKAFLTFSADKLQVVSSSNNQSIIGIWTTAPKFDNIAGTIEFEGGVPKGIVVSSGILAKITFKVKSTGVGQLAFQNTSRVFLNDGHATDDLNQAWGASFQFKSSRQVSVMPPSLPVVVLVPPSSPLPPLPIVPSAPIFPAAPKISSDNHIDQSKWYIDNSAIMRFSSLDRNGSLIQTYSYEFSSNPLTIPDEIPNNPMQPVVLSNIPFGVSYFHVRGESGGAWGETGHFILRTGSGSANIQSHNSAVQGKFKWPSFITSQGIQIKNWILIPWLWVFTILLLILLIIGLYEIKINK